MASTDMTKGGIIRQLAGYAIPLILGSMFQLAYNAVDSMIAGRFIGADALAATGMAGPVMNILILGISGLSIGAGVIMSAYFGAGNHQMLSRELSTLLGAGTVFSIAAAVLGILFASPLLRLLNVPDSVLDMTAAYLSIIFIGLPFTCFYNALSQAMKSVGDSKTPLKFLAASSVLNCLLDLFLFAADDGDVLPPLEHTENIEVFIADALLPVHRLVALRLAAARDAPHTFLGGKVEEDRQIGAQQRHGGFVEFDHPIERHKTAVVRERRKIISVAQNGHALVELFQKSVDGVRDMVDAVGGEQRRNGALVRLHPPRQTGAQKRAERRFRRLVRAVDGNALCFEILPEHLHLRALAASVRALEYDKFPFCSHNVCIIPNARPFVNGAQRGIRAAEKIPPADFSAGGIANLIQKILRRPL